MRFSLRVMSKVVLSASVLHDERGRCVRSCSGVCRDTSSHNIHLSLKYKTLCRKTATCWARPEQRCCITKECWWESSVSIDLRGPWTYRPESSTSTLQLLSQLDRRLLQHTVLHSHVYTFNATLRTRIKIEKFERFKVLYETSIQYFTNAIFIAEHAKNYSW